MKSITILLFLVTAQAFGQHDYKGKIVDSKTREAIPFVNVGVFEKEIGTVSDEEGIFHLPINDIRIKASDIVVFSSLGYQSIKKLVSSVELVYNDYPIIEMTPSSLELEEVVVSDNANYMVPETVGYSNKGEEVFGYWKDNIALGGELGTKVIVKNGLRRLDRFIFEVWHNPSDSLLLRVNVYDNDGKLSLPKTNLNTSGKNILYSLSSNERMVSIDLKPYDIYVKSDFVISLELLNVYGQEELGLIVAATSDDGHGTYRKYASQGKWERITDANMAYTLKTSRLVNQSDYERFQKRKEKTETKKRYVSGFAIVKGKMISGVGVFNHRTKDSVTTDEQGRFSIAALKNDIISFTKKGYKPMSYKINTKPTLNVKLIPL